MRPDAHTGLLLACLHQDPARLGAHGLPAPESHEWRALADLAAVQRVRPIVHRRLRMLPADRQPPEAVLRELETASRQTGLRNLRFHGEVAAIARTLSDRGVPLIVLKGAHLVASFYESVALREMSDIDVLVHPDHLQQAVDAAVGRGYAPATGSSIDVDPAIGHHLARLLRPGVAGVEIHWSITPPADPHAIDPAGLWKRAVPVTIGGVRILGLSAEDLLLHLCFHLSYQHQFRFGLRPFCDIAAVIARVGDRLDWPGLAERADAWGWRRGVYLSLRLAGELVGAAVPPEALTGLRPGGVDDAVATAARDHLLSPSEIGPVNPGVARLAGTESLGVRLRLLRDRLVPPRAELARMYGLPADSSRVLLAYLRRAADMTRQHAASATRLLLGRDAGLAADAARADVLRRWLDS
jgi:hypothetical protein